MEPYLFETYRTNVQFGGDIDGIPVELDPVNKVGVIIAKTREMKERIESHQLYARKLIWPYKPSVEDNIKNPFDEIFSPSEMYGISQLTEDKKQLIRDNVLGILGVAINGALPSAGGESIQDIVNKDEEFVIDENKKSELANDEAAAELSEANVDEGLPANTVKSVQELASRRPAGKGGNQNGKKSK